MGSDAIGGYEEIVDIKAEKTKVVWIFDMVQTIILFMINIFGGFIILKSFYSVNLHLMFILFLVVEAFGFFLIFGGTKLFLKLLNYWFSISEADLFSPEMDRLVNLEAFDEKIIKLKV